MTPNDKQPCDPSRLIWGLIILLWWLSMKTTCLLSYLAFFLFPRVRAHFPLRPDLQFYTSGGMRSAELRFYIVKGIVSTESGVRLATLVWFWIYLCSGCLRVDRQRIRLCLNLRRAKHRLIVPDFPAGTAIHSAKDVWCVQAERKST